MGKPSIQVQEWMVFLSGIHIFIYESRFLNFLFNLFKFIVCINITLVSDNKILKLLLYISIILLFPYVCIRLIDIIIFLGKMFCIADKDIYSVFKSIGLQRFFYWLLSFNKYKSDDDISKELEKLHMKVIENKNMFDGNGTVNALHQNNNGIGNGNDNGNDANANADADADTKLENKYKSNTSTSTTSTTTTTIKKNKKPLRNSEVELKDITKLDL
jgi:hypothetical protein